MFTLILTSWTMLVYSGLRLLFLLWNGGLFHAVSGADVALAFLEGLRFDLSAIAMMAAPTLLFEGILWTQKRSRPGWLALTWGVFHIPFLIMNLGDVEFVQFTGRRFSLSGAAVVGEVQGKFWATMFSYAGLFAIAFATVTLFSLSLWWLARGPAGRARLSRGGRRAPVIAGVLIFLFLFVGARGGLQKKPIGFAHAQVFANPVLNHLTLNSTFTFLQTLRRTPLPREHYMSESEMRALVNGGTPGESLWSKNRLRGGPTNVVIIILESFSLEHMGAPHGDAGYTPFLDELSKRSLFFPNAYANARRSIEGIGAILGGIPAMMNEPFISSQYATNTFWGLGTWLGQAGYSSEFFHGGNNGTMYFDQFIRSAGIQKYYGASEYPNPKDHDGTWGIWDEPFFLNMVKELNQMSKPFAAAVFSLSSHSPFKVPAGFEGKFPKGASEIHEVVGYTDWALRQFFAAAEKEPWYPDTLFIVTADHTFKPVRPEYQNDLGNYRIPLLIFHPAIEKWPALDLAEPVQQIDLLPSILDFLGLRVTQENLLGRSVFRTGRRHVVLESDGTYWLVTKDRVLQQSGASPAILSDLKTGSPVVDPSAQADLERRLQATRQYFSEGLWDNKLYYPSGR